jgi:hypothetical protein
MEVDKISMWHDSNIGAIALKLLPSSGETRNEPIYVRFPVDDYPGFSLGKFFLLR